MRSRFAFALGIGSLGALAFAACTPRPAGFVRPDHPLLGDESGRSPLAPAHQSVVLFDDAAPDDDGATRQARASIARVAAAAVGGGAIVVAGKKFRMDCSGVARGIYAKAGYPLGSVDPSLLGGATNDTRVLFELVKQSGSLRKRAPLAGDLVFFDDTWDQNGNGLRDDPLSHVGVVEKVEGDTVVMVHRAGNAIVRARMTLTRPRDRRDEKGRPLNHYLRTAQRGQPAQTAAELFVAFGSLPLHDNGTVVAARE